MANLSRYTSVFPARPRDAVRTGPRQQEGQQEDTDAGGSTSSRSQVRRKPRPIVSCHYCRTRKQRCDRLSPCGNCVRRGDGPSCRYGSNGTATGAADYGRRRSGTVRGDITSPTKIRQEAQARLQRLEELVNQLASRPAAASGGGAEEGGEDRAAGGIDEAVNSPKSPSSPRRDIIYPLPLRSYEWKFLDENEPVVHGNPVTKMLGEKPFAGETNWAAVLDGIRDIQSYMGGVDESCDERDGEDGPGEADNDSSMTPDGITTSTGMRGAAELADPSPRSDRAKQQDMLHESLQAPGTTSARSGVSLRTVVSLPTKWLDDTETRSIFARSLPQPSGLASSSNPTTLSSFLASAVAALPPRSACDHLLTAYFQARFIGGPFLHVNQFQRAYARFWSTGSPASAHATSPALWLSMLASVLSLGAKFSGNQRIHYTCQDPGSLSRADSAAGDSSSSSSNREDGTGTNEDLKLANRLHRLSTRCLLAVDYLAGPPLAVEALMLNTFARMIFQRDPDAVLWATLGVATRLAQRLGYQHVDAPKDRTGRLLTPFEKEMRRRIWLSVELFDAFFSFQFGMPSVIHEDETATNPPSNLHDDDFDEGSVVLPASRPPTDVTGVQFCSAKLIMVRQVRKIVRFVMWQGNDTAEIVTSAAAKDLVAELHRIYTALPPNLRMPTHIRDCPFTDTSYLIMHRMNLETLFYQGLLVLYRPCIAREGHAQERRTCIVAALRIIDLHIDFEAEIRPPVFGVAFGSTAPTSGHGGGRLYADRFSLNRLSRHDFLLAATILCLDLIEGGSCPPATGHDSASEWPPSEQPTLEQRAADRRAKLTTLRKADSLWRDRRFASRDSAHASRILGAIVSKLDAAEGEAAVAEAAAEAVITPTGATTTGQQTAEETAVPWYFYATGGYSAGTAEQKSSLTDQTVPDEFDAVLNDPHNVDWKMIDTFLLQLNGDIITGNPL